MRDLLIRYGPALLGGIATTLELWVIISMAGLSVGVLIGWEAARSPRLRWLEAFGRWLVAVLPALVAIMWVYYPLQTMLHIEISSFWSCALALSVLNVFSVAVVIRSSWNSIPQELRLLAPMYDTTHRTAFFLIEAPLLFRLSLPALVTIEIAMLHATLLGSFIGVDETLKVIGRINAIEYLPIELYTILAGIFVILCFPLTLLSSWLNKRYLSHGL